MIVMDYVIVALLVVLIGLVFVLILKLNKNTRGDKEVSEKLFLFQNSLTKEIGDFKYDFANNLKKDFESLNDRRSEEHTSELQSRI